MKDFKSIRKICETSRRTSKTVIDDFLLYYAAVKHRPHRTMADAIHSKSFIFFVGHTGLFACGS